MERKDFLKTACTLGICSCAGFSFLGSQTFFGKDQSQQNQDDWKLGFIQRRFAKLVAELENIADPAERYKILEAMGRTCASEYSDQIIKFKGNVEEYLSDLKSKWIEDAVINKEENWIKLIGKKKDSCGCPFIDKNLTPKYFCNCSIGYIKQTYETLLEKHIDVKIEKSILAGDERCNFLISIS